MRVSLSDQLISGIEFEPNTGCWLWSGRINHGGYGLLGKRERAHRLSWKIHRGEIPDGLCVLHRCDTPACVNPEHLWVGTVAENNADRSAKGRGAKVHKRAVRTYGEGMNRSKLSNEDVAEIKKGLDGVAATARRFGVSKAHIYRIRSGICRANDHLGRVNVSTIDAILNDPSQ